MDAQLIAWAAAAAALAITVGGAIWWLQRQRLAALEQRLQESEDSRFELADEAMTLRHRLDRTERTGAAAHALRSDLAARRAALELVLAAGPAAAGPVWQETQPMTLPPERAMFAPTEPAPLMEPLPDPRKDPLRARPTEPVADLPSR